MKRLFSSLLLSVALGVGVASAEEHPVPTGTLIPTTPTPTAAALQEREEPPILTIDPLGDDQIDIFIDSIRSATPFTLPSPHESERVDPNLAGLWAGSTVKASSDIRQIILRFRRRAEDLIAAASASEFDPNTLLEYFDVTIDPSRKWITYTHSHPELRRDVDGFNTRIDRPMKESFSPFIRGQRESGLYYVIPPFEDTSKLWGVLVCPRRLTKATLPGGLQGAALQPSPYELSEVMFTSEAEVQVSMSTAGQKGRAQATLKLSKGLPKSRSYVDSSLSTMPRAALQYKPVIPPDFFRFAPHNAVQEGLKLEVEMTSKAGYQRTQHFGQTIYLKKFTEPPPIKVVAEGKRVVSDMGDCYIIMDFSYSWMTYNKTAPELIFQSPGE